MISSLTSMRLIMCAHRINKNFSNYTLLDAGCRTQDIKPLLNSCDQYFGTDILPPDGNDILQCDLNKGFPFSDRSFDIVVALDVLEHLDNPHGALSEMLRVARKAVYISLPNMYYCSFRWNFLVGKGISGKYSFPIKPLLDRHRWILSYKEALSFILANIRGYSCIYEMILPPRGRTRKILHPIQKILANKWPNMFAYGVLFEVKL